MTPTRRPRTRGLAASTVLALALLAGCAASPAGPSAPVPDADPVPGAAGPCGFERREVPNPADGQFPTIVFEPTGDGRPVTGGRCDDAQRPLALVAHGYLGALDAAYAGLLEHLVSQGFVVVFPTWPIEFDPPHQYDVVDTGAVAGVAASGRVDTSRVGVVGHSFGAGMIPWLLRQADDRGWGTDAMWAVSFAPWFSLLLPPGPIDVPDHTRVAVVAYQDDYLVDARIGIEVLGSLDVPRDQRVHLLARTDMSGTPILSADHLGPVGFTLPWLGPLSVDQLDRWAWRVVDATAGCSLSGTWCDEDLGDVGTWPDGDPVRRAVVSRDPVDAGPVALQECTFLLNPRPCGG